MEILVQEHALRSRTSNPCDVSAIYFSRSSSTSREPDIDGARGLVRRRRRRRRSGRANRRFPRCSARAALGAGGSDKAFPAFRAEAVRAFNDLTGPAGEALAMKMEKATTARAARTAAADRVSDHQQLAR
jgi:hypothetical protein